MKNKHSMEILIEQLQRIDAFNIEKTKRMNGYQEANEKLNIQVKDGLIENLKSSYMIDELRNK